MTNGIAGAVLVGGKSRRMGRDKAFLPVAGAAMVERVARALAEAVGRVVLVGGEPERFHDLGLPTVPDLRPGSSLGGIYTALVACGTPYVLVAPCDLPFPSASLFRLLASLREGYDVVVPRRESGFEPVCGVYAARCADAIAAQLDKGNFRISDLYPSLSVRYVTAEELAAVDPRGLGLRNVNTPQEFAAALGERMTVPAVSFVAPSGTGKTTLLEKVIAVLKERGYRVGALKHDAHRFDIDQPGKDSWRLTAAGADATLISSPEKLALVKRHPASPPVEELVATYFADVDIVLTEGFGKGGLPKIEVHRGERNAPLLCRGEETDPTLVAVASDEPLALDVPVLDLNDATAVADFIEARFLRPRAARS